MFKWQDHARREFGSVACVKERVGLPAVSKYSVLRHWLVPAKGRFAFWGRDRWFSLVQLRILTGRTHQIRLHMAFLGHPLVGDIKYNAQRFEDDKALVPRIFLHCLRMEFQDLDGSTFVAASDLAPDLQVVLAQMQSSSASEQEPMSGSSSSKHFCKQRLFPGFAQLLAKSSPPKPSAGAAEATRRIVHFCNICGEWEVSERAVLQRGRKSALYWRVRQHQGPDDITSEQNEKADTESWGQPVLWVPTELQEEVEDAVTPSANPIPEQKPLEEPGSSGMREKDDLPPAWGALGSEWAWAHDGSRPNGWIRMLTGGILATKWGGGTWQVANSPPRAGEEATPPLLIATFGSDQHVLRLDPANGTGARSFNVVAKQRTTDGKPLDQEFAELTKSCCPTRGWLS
ncbi:unnamed protein product [Polarella glacialis]|uniref:Pseudouridine synthase RsuA/RluA-like domain-containing protein n=1 Tax=Polarella glacialis TaxID=89957 RepID=A0A813DMK4_POLGL|nr:unnamed protein product [Polarella glacialis]CAE8715215.1 unnamed protein product [Polarella glacialis]